MCVLWYNTHQIHMNTEKKLLGFIQSRLNSQGHNSDSITQFNQVERNPYEAVMERYAKLDETVQDFIQELLAAGEALETIQETLQTAGLIQPQGGKMPESYDGGADAEQNRQRIQFEKLIRELVEDGKTDDEIQQTLGFGNYTPPPKAKQ
jgi:hypothetical protein